jgi:maleylpyruvate isomerase
LAFERRL